MKKFLEISRTVRQKGYGYFLSYLLVKKSLEIVLESPNTIFIDVDFN
ncbi:MAG TPA: hypothetical protein PLS10_13980 [Chitinophagales bacterium]|nr:hypothetical protein [Chitinophagales bacterium]